MMREDASVVYMTDSVEIQRVVDQYPDCDVFSIAPDTFNPTGLGFVAVKDSGYTQYFSKV